MQETSQKLKAFRSHAPGYWDSHHVSADVWSDYRWQLKNRVNSAIRPELARVSTTEKNQQKYYRVRIGPINTVEYADELSQTLSNKGFGQARIVID